MSKYTAFRCPEDLLIKAKARANKDHRSLSNYLITLIAKDVGGSMPAAKSKARAPKKAASRSRK